MLIIAIILFGMIAGAAAQLLLGKPAGGIDWSLSAGRAALPGGYGSVDSGVCLVLSRSRRIASGSAD